ncbi:DNA-processing protein DprA [Actinokineospora sp. UTMC 2448]|uniref:DNA-processing protein DprA n=1 Tax=Actinokineospora sp. UTMC 2448 TaxID=2268449 RepID=UPI0021644DE3|nr:DNA-processing protein DprA [Actinokineospora sp. UTMC 2448]UVS81238.1 DNA protecting protein DprA [Actinokineospora sp. UTMC 2448]
MTSRKERGALVALLQDRPGGATWRRITDQVADRGSAVAVFDELCPGDLFSTTTANETRFEEAAQAIDAWEAAGFGVYTILDESYPNQLRDVLHMPPIVFTRGALADDARAVAIVGSRKASERGLEIAARLASGLGERGFTIVSGGAAGIDSAAHTAALDVGARTVAVIGTGIRHYYPAENRRLHDRIAQRGMVLSQFWPDARPNRASFPMRNAVMSGYVNATIVVEAGERSGTRIQARNAVEHGRPILLTDRVVDANSWAKAMVGQPGVHVVAGLSDVLRVLELSQDDDEAVNRLLRAASI